LGWTSLAALLAAVLAVSPTNLSALAQGVTDGRDLPVVEHVLENGMRFLLLPRPGAPTVAFVTHIGVGSVHDPPGATGTSHILEHLLFKGTTTVGTRDLDAELELFALMDAAQDSLDSLGGAAASGEAAERLESRIRALEDSARVFAVSGEFDEILTRNGARGLNATTGYEATEYTVSLPANRAKLWFVLESDRMRNAVFRDFYAERSVVAQERLTRVESSPGTILFETHIREAFRTHPYGLLPIGRMEDILSLTRADVREHFQRYYGAGNTTVAIVGAFDADSAVAWADAYFGPLPPGDAAPESSSPEPPQTEPRVVEVTLQAEPTLRVSWKVPGVTDPDAPALAMLANVLVGSRDSRLYRRLVRDDRIARSVVASMEPGGRDPGIFTIQADPLSPSTPEALLAVILEELDRLRREPPEPGEIERVRARLEAASVRRLASNEGLALQLVASQALWGDWRETFGLQEQMRAVGPDDIAGVLERYFRDGGRTVGILRRAAAQRPQGPGLP
jgi:predicted Zn-dependent peptidase